MVDRICGKGGTEGSENRLSNSAVNFDSLQTFEASIHGLSDEKSMAYGKSNFGDRVKTVFSPAWTRSTTFALRW
jgi:hypothetical protein